MRSLIQPSFMRTVLIGLALPCLGHGASKVQAQIAVEPREFSATVTSYWVITQSRAPKDTKIYGRFAFHAESGRLLNQMNFICPKSRRTYPHLTIYLDDMIKLGAPYKPFTGKVEGQFAIEGGGAITLPGASIDTELFFDRTPATIPELDRVLNAESVRFRVGATRVAYETNTKFDDLMRELLVENAGATGFFVTEDMLTDCRKYRGEGAP